MLGPIVIDEDSTENAIDFKKVIGLKTNVVEKIIKTNEIEKMRGSEVLGYI